VTHPVAVRSARILTLQLRDVRTWQRLDLELTAGTTLLAGLNGVGKTNLLEACATVLTGSSPRTSSELRLVRDGEQLARIAARIRIGEQEHDRSVVLQVGRGKQLRVDANAVRGVEEYARAVPVVTFLPERLLTIRGAPQRRRALVDALVQRLVPGAAATQRDYARVLQQRNALLRRARAGARVEEQLAPWTQQLLELGERLRSERTLLLDRLAGPFAGRLAALTTLDGGTFEQQLRGSGDLAADLADVASAELRRGTTLLGPHLDDVLPRIAGRDVRAFGSAGEQRATLLAYTLAARDLLAADGGVEPIVLLDEPWSELDADRRRRLTALIEPLAQVVVTSTEPPAHLRSVLPAATVLAISSGQVRPWPDDEQTDSR
jgi:DNA replication and repair protein RecF